MQEELLTLLENIKHVPPHTPQKWKYTLGNITFVLHHMIRDELSFSFERAVFELPYSRKSSVDAWVDLLLPVFHMISHNLRPIEVDAHEHRILLRTNPPEPWLNESFRYDEMWVYEKNGRICWQWQKYIFSDDTPRQSIPIALTVEHFLAFFQQLSRIKL